MPCVHEVALPGIVIQNADDESHKRPAPDVFIHLPVEARDGVGNRLCGGGAAAGCRRRFLVLAALLDGDIAEGGIEREALRGFAVAAMRQHATAVKSEPQEAPKPQPEKRRSPQELDDYLDIPAFLRRQAD